MLTLKQSNAITEKTKVCRMSAVSRNEQTVFPQENAAEKNCVPGYEIPKRFDVSSPVFNIQFASGKGSCLNYV